jgi:hypothetical protein
VERTGRQGRPWTPPAGGKRDLVADSDRFAVAGSAGGVRVVADRVWAASDLVGRRHVGPGAVQVAARQTAMTPSGWSGSTPLACELITMPRGAEGRTG